MEDVDKLEGLLTQIWYTLSNLKVLLNAFEGNKINKVVNDTLSVLSMYYTSIAIDAQVELAKKYMDQLDHDAIPSGHPKFAKLIEHFRHIDKAVAECQKNKLEWIKNNMENILYILQEKNHKNIVTPTQEWVDTMRSFVPWK